MGWVLMSERELQRVEVLTAILAGRQSVCAAARLLGLSRRHVHRLINAYRAEGASVLRKRQR